MVVLINFVIFYESSLPAGLKVVIVVVIVIVTTNTNTNTTTVGKDY